MLNGHGLSFPRPEMPTAAERGACVRLHISPLTTSFFQNHVKWSLEFLCSLAPLATSLLSNEELPSSEECPPLQTRP